MRDSYNGKFGPMVKLLGIHLQVKSSTSLAKKFLSPILLFIILTYSIKKYIIFNL